MGLSLKKIERFHRKKSKIPKIILGSVGSKEIIHGQQALNKRFPGFLKRPTRDYDVYSRTPKQDARQAERRLDKSFGGDFFYVIPAKHPGTFKVKAHATEETHADFTFPTKRIFSDKINGKRYIKLSQVKKHIRKTLKDKTSEHRHDKDRDSLNRIKVFERLHLKAARKRK